MLRSERTKPVLMPSDISVCWRSLKRNSELAFPETFTGRIPYIASGTAVSGSSSDIGSFLTTGPGEPYSPDQSSFPTYYSVNGTFSAPGETIGGLEVYFAYSPRGTPGTYIVPNVQFTATPFFNEHYIELIIGGTPMLVSNDTPIPLGATIQLGSGHTTGDDTFQGTTGNDLAYGNQGADRLLGTSGNDTMFGGQGSDMLLGGPDADRLFGNMGADIIYGNQGADIIYGNQGADQLYGGYGSDVLFGGQGADTLIGATGPDTLVGGAGADRYVFGAGSGADLIIGFSATQGDKLDVQGQTYASADDGQGGTLLTLSGGGTVDLAGVAQGSLTSAAFV
jgi:Ca2+-binding RTX toxin-like protein